MSHTRSVRIVAFVLIITLTLMPPLGSEFRSGSFAGFSANSLPPEMIDDTSTLSADPATQIEYGNLLIIELVAESISSHGAYWSELLHSYGIPTETCTTAELGVSPFVLSSYSIVLIDASLGSDNGSHVSRVVIEQLEMADLPTILTGRAAWLLHLLREQGPPSQTAPSTTSLLTTPGLEGAVFLTSPTSLTIGTVLTTENPVLLPKDAVQSERSRLIDLTGRESQTHLASLRYESWPLDLFLFSPEDPTQLTAQGMGLLVNTIAYSKTLRENSITENLASQQTDSSDKLSGGFSYAHEPTMQATYFAVHAVKSLLAPAEWDVWRTSRSTKVQDILETLLVDYGSETGFRTSAIDNVVNLKTTAQGLWLISVMGLCGSFPVLEVVTYLSNCQDVKGHFGNHVTTSYYVTEALNQSDNLSSINVVALESWLRSCVIDGGKTSDPDLWGAIAGDPSSLSPSNEYAAHYALALNYLGTSHNDPLKLTQWITTRTSNSDGSFNNTLTPSEELVIGTASAAIALSLLGTLTPENSSSIIGWFEENQLSSGGFGLKEKDGDIAAKTEESYAVARALIAMNEASSSTASGLVGYFALVETDVGFEIMEPLPTLMWSYWMSVMARQNHALRTKMLIHPTDYLACFSQLSQYPFWNNLTAYTAPEYGINQYRSKSVWSQFFGIAMALEMGIGLSPGVISDAVSYILQSQYILGHFRPALFSGTAQMQYTVASVEALYLVDALGSIYYRTSLESAILSEYNSGSWSAAGWSLRPFSGQQSAIDWLSTRAALRLGIIDASMAEEIAIQIQSRIQYDDLWALSCDVATLALLNSSGFAVNLESLDTSKVLASLGPTPFQNGWFNSTTLYQPVLSTNVLEMVSILGLHVHLFDNLGSTLTASSASTCELGSEISIEVSISSSASNHDVLVYVFGDWTYFGNVLHSGMLVLDVPDDIDSLGPEDIYLQIDDWGISKSFALIEITVTGTIRGDLSLDTSLVTIGEKINGSAIWFLEGGFDAGDCSVSVRLGDSLTYQQWNYESSSPFGISIPTTDFQAGQYNLTITITREFCQALVLQEQVQLVSPEPTYLLAPSLLSGMIDELLVIPWSLHLVSNDSEVENQLIEITIVNEGDQILYTAFDFSKIGGISFVWTPLQHGNLTYTLSFSGNGSLTPSEFDGTIEVYENTQMIWNGVGIQDQYSSISLEGQLLTLSGIPIIDEIVQVSVTSPSFTTVLESSFVSNSSGYIQFTIFLHENGNYSLAWMFPASGFLKGSSGSETITAWSSSYLETNGIPSEALVGETWNAWALLLDSDSNPIPEQPVTLRVLLLPSTVVFEQTIPTNSSGFAVLQWTGVSAGFYHYEVLYSGSASRESAYDILPFYLWIPVTLTINQGEDPSVGVGTWIQIVATDQTAIFIDDLCVLVTIRGPNGELVFSDSGVTANGAIYLSWIPSHRGTNNITAVSSRQGYYEFACAGTLVGVSETPAITIDIDPNLMAPSSIIISILVEDTSGMPICDVHVQIYSLLNAIVLLDETDATDTSGLVNCVLDLSEPGVLSIEVLIPTQKWILSTSLSEVYSVTGATTLILTTPGQPVEQGTSIAILATLIAWNGQPLSGAQVSLRILWANGTIVASASKITGENGICTMAYDFDAVGDFLVNATYIGQQLNASATISAPQRVYIIPLIQILHSPSCLLGESIQIQLGLLDIFGAGISGRTLLVEIAFNSVLVFESQVQSETGLITINWSPSQRGQAVIEVLHAGDVHYYTNISQSSTSVLEQVSGDISLSSSIIDLFDSVSLTYTLSASQLQGISVTLETLDVDLVPLWWTTMVTNGSGMADVTYTATHAHGFLLIRARIEVNQFLIGGDMQVQLNVMSECNTTLSLEPQPPCAGQLSNITITVFDELGVPLNGLSITITLFDPMGEQVKLGTFTKSVTVQSINGIVRVPFTPSLIGLYTIGATSSGAVSIHPFTESGLHTVYSTTVLAMFISQSEIEVGDTISINLLLVDYSGTPIMGRNVTMLLDGPGPAAIGPVELVTNTSGYAFFNTAIGVEGVWIFQAVFDGLGVYLPSSISEQMNVRYETTIETSIVNGLAIAGQSSIVLTVLLIDRGGTPLEGFTIRYQAYHDLYGLWDEGTVIQQGQEPMELELELDRMGNYTILLTFDGTTHYHPSMAAESVQVMGTTAVSFNGPLSFDRAETATLSIIILDEIFSSIPLDEFSIAVEMVGPSGEVNLGARFTNLTQELQLDLCYLPVGQYSVNVVISDSRMRMGTSDSFVFQITSETSIYIVEEQLSGLLGQAHILAFVLEDSLHELIFPQIVHVSIYNSEGQEIYGSPLTERTTLQVVASGTQISWTPASVGEYRIVLVFDGTSNLNSCSFERYVLVRYVSSIDVSMAERVQYGNSIAVSISLTGGITNLQNMELTVRVDLDGRTEQQFSVTTGAFGRTSFSIIGLFSGNHSIIVSFDGTSIHAPVNITKHVAVEPIVIYDLKKADSLHARDSCSANLTVSIMGVNVGWQGTLDVILLSPSGAVLGLSSFAISQYSSRIIEFVVSQAGPYYFNCTTSGLPVLGADSHLLAITVDTIPLIMDLDAGVAPVVGGVGILIIIGVVFWRHLDRLLGVIPTEWSG